MKNTSISSSSSGWTLYLEHSTHDHHDDRTFIKKIQCYQVHGDNDAHYESTTQEEEDLSMVSDASSGPPHTEEPLEDLFRYASRKRVSQNIISGNNVKLGRRRFEAEDFSLDDTASSPPIINLLFSASKGNEVENQGSSMDSLTDYSSHGYSATHFQAMVESRKSR